MLAPEYNNYKYIHGAATTQVKAVSGILVAIIINAGTATDTIGIIDGTAGTTVNVGQITVPAAPVPVTLLYNLRFAQGLRIVTSGADDITVVYQ